MALNQRQLNVLKAAAEGQLELTRQELMSVWADLYNTSFNVILHQLQRDAELRQRFNASSTLFVQAATLHKDGMYHFSPLEGTHIRIFLGVTPEVSLLACLWDFETNNPEVQKVLEKHKYTNDLGYITPRFNSK